MLDSVLLKTLRDRRRAFVWWSAGLVAYVAMHGAVYPTVSSSSDFQKLVERYPQALKGLFGFGGSFDIVTGAGYLGIELFSLIVPLILLMLTIGGGSAALAGEEERGTLDLLLSLPLTRRRCALEKLGALALEVAVLGLVLWLALLVTVAAADMRVSAGNLAAATLNAVLLACAFGAVALAAGAASGHRALAAGVAGGLALTAYVVNSLADLVAALERIRVVSPFYYYSRGDPLRHGFQALDAGVLLAIAAVAGVLALIAFERRDLVAP